jgi:hypothetical protein
LAARKVYLAFSGAATQAVKGSGGGVPISRLWLPPAAAWPASNPPPPSIDSPEFRLVCHIGDSLGIAARSSQGLIHPQTIGDLLLRGVAKLLFNYFGVSFGLDKHFNLNGIGQITKITKIMSSDFI